MQATALPGTASGYAPFFAPDGRSLAFLHAGSRTVKKLALSAGAPSLLCPYESSSGSGAWGPGDSIYMTLQNPGGLVKVASSGGAPKPVTTLDSNKDEMIHMRPILLPGGKAILFAIGGGGMDTYDDARIAVPLETGERKILIEGGIAPAYSPTGHIIYAHDGKLLAVPFDLKRLAVTGSPVPVLEGVFMCVNTGSAHYSLAANGTLAYAPGVVLGGARQLVWVDRTGKAEMLSTPARAYLHPRISPDGTRLAVEVEGPTHDFWSYDQARGIMTDIGRGQSPASTDAVWRPKGGELYCRDGDKMMVVEVNTRGSFQSSKPSLLWTGRYAHGLGSQCGPAVSV
jgi:serine/threonine-protein kinase